MDEAALAEMIASIRQWGILQPIIFRVDEQGNVVVVSGACRVAAARALGLPTIPGLFLSGHHEDVAMVENLIRQDLTHIEVAEGLQHLMDKQGYTQEQLSRIIGKAQNTVSEILSLNRLPQAIRDDCRADRTLSRGSLLAIAQKKQTHAMITAYQTLKNKLTRVKDGQEKKDRNEPQSVRAFLVKTASRIDALDPSAWTTEEQENFQTSLVVLKTIIDRYLTPPAPSA